MTLPPREHPGWRLTGKALDTLAILALVFLLYHLGLGSHEGAAADTYDATGGALLVNVLFRYVKSLAKESDV